MKNKRRNVKRTVCLSVALAGMILLAAYELFGLGDKIFPSLDEQARYLCGMAITRFIGGGIFLAMLINLGYRVLAPYNRTLMRSILILLPAFLVAVNNFPFSCLLAGRAVIDAPAWRILLLAVECLCIAFFEETAFRGVVLLGLIGRKPQSRLWVFWSVVLTSVIFGLIHLVNLYQSSPVAVLLQIGYSTLIGAMCSVVLIKSADLWLCVILHAVFNFGGAVVQYCGRGEIWDTFTVIFTAALAVFTTGYLIFVFLRAELGIFNTVYGTRAKKQEINIEQNKERF